MPAQLVTLLQTKIPSRRASRILKDLSSNVVCGITGWHQNKASEVYRKWCLELWELYLYANELDPMLWSGNTPQLDQATWEAALEDAQREQQDDSSSEDYDSSDSEPDSRERDDTPDTTISFDDSLVLRHGADRLQSVPTNDRSTTQPVSVQARQPSGGLFDTIRDQSTTQPVSGQPRQPSGGFSDLFRDRSTTRSVLFGESRQPSRSVFGVYRDPEAPPVESRQPYRSMFGVSRDPNIAVTQSRDRKPSPWSHGASDAAVSSASVSRTEPRSTGSNTSLLFRFLPPTAEPLGISQETAVEELVASEDTGSEWSDSPGESEAEAESPPGNEVGETEVGSQNGNNDEEQIRASLSGLEIADSISTNSGLDHTDERSTGNLSLESGAPATDRVGDGDGDHARDLLSIDESLFDNVEVNEVVTTPLALISSRPGFRLYPQASTPLSQLKQLWNTMAQTVSSSRRHKGFIYAFERASFPGFLKIGYVQGGFVPQRSYPDPVAKRLAKWEADCGSPLIKVFSEEIDCEGVERIESLVHLTLRESRRVQDPPCRPCERRGWARRGHRGEQGRGGGKHDEWFEVDVETAKRMVKLWAWFAVQKPYDSWGRLVDFWSAKVNEERLLAMEGDTAMSWVERMSQMVEELRRREFGSIIGPLRR